jgi:hypothetical protein
MHYRFSRAGEAAETKTGQLAPPRFLSTEHRVLSTTFLHSPRQILFLLGRELVDFDAHRLDLQLRDAT